MIQRLDAHDTLPTFHSTVSFLGPLAPRKSNPTAAERLFAQKKLFSVYDVKFCPFTPRNAAPVFVAVGHIHAIVCRPSRDPSKGVDILRWFRDQDPDAGLNSVVWTYSPHTRHPCICVAGAKPIIKVLDVKTGQLIQTLTGHGGAVQDLAVHPQNPEILVSASADFTARLWHLGPAYRKKPCAAVFSGPDGHQQSLLSVAFHRNGRWLLTAGMDAAVHLWKVPEIPNADTGSDRILTVRWAHMRTYAVHFEKVDCVQFYGDLILSKSCASLCARNRIALWRIEGFSTVSDQPHCDTDDFLPPKRREADTWSAFGTGVEQLLSLDIPNSRGYYIRFGLLHRPLQAPLLAIGNESGRVLFWNLEKIEHGVVGRKRATRSKKALLHDSTSDRDTTSSKQHVTVSHINGPFKHQQPHKEFKLPRLAMENNRATPDVCYQASWSADGNWCVVGASDARIHLFRRTPSRHSENA